MIHSVNGLNRMKTVFISNYYSPHQQPLADALAAHSDFSFICTKEMPEEYSRMTDQGTTVSRAVGDYISGMTDTYCVRRFREIFEPKSWDIF